MLKYIVGSNFYDGNKDAVCSINVTIACRDEQIGDLVGEQAMTEFSAVSSRIGNKLRDALAEPAGGSTSEGATATSEEKAAGEQAVHGRHDRARVVCDPEDSSS